MEKKYFCCVSVLIETDEDLEAWLKSFADDPSFLREHLRIHLLDKVGSKAALTAMTAFRSVYPDNVFVHTVPEDSYPKSYNSVIQEEDKALFMNFTNTSAFLKASDLRKMEAQMHQNPNVGIWSFFPVHCQPDGVTVPYFQGSLGNGHFSNSRYDRFSNYLPGYLIRNDMISADFDESAPDDADVLFLWNAIFFGKDYVLTNLPLVSKDFFENDYYNYRRQFNPLWYTETLRSVYLPFLKKHPKSPFCKAMVMYQICVRFACNRNDRNKSLLQGEALDDFFSVVSEALQRIDDNLVIVYNMNNMKMLPKFMGLVFLRIKYNNNKMLPTIATDGTSNYTAVYKQALIDSKSTLKMSITCMDYDKRSKELVIDGKLNNAYVFDYRKIQCFGSRAGGWMPVVPTQVYSLEKFFGVSMYKDFTFQIRYSTKELEQMRNICFRFKYGDLVVNLPITFPRMESRLVDKFPDSYWQFSKFMLTYNAKKFAIQISKRSHMKALKQELKLYGNFLHLTSGDERKRAVKSIFLRMAYWTARPFFRKKQVWLTFDQLFKGGDNGEYFFRYVADHHSDLVDMYYIANNTCADYKRLAKTYRNLLPFNSFKAKLVAMNATCVFATRVDVKQYCGFGPQLEYFHRGLLNYDVFCLQHGLTIQRIAQYQNRLFDNTKLYFCVSPNEIQNLSHPVYGYKPDMLLLTGAPRYDPLISNDKRQILIAPTWRRNVTAGTNKKGHQHAYSVNFKETEYYRIYNSLINNKELINCAKKTGYRIIYLVHPILSPQVGDFHGPEQVTIVAGANGNVSYEQMMKESSLMLTDHSGIQFDFASMRKPLVYYHPDTLPPQYDAGGMDYESQAFGPVCRNEEEVVAALCKAMLKDCQMDDKYRARADKFFAFDDHDNCKRIFEAAAKHQKLKK